MQKKLRFFKRLKFFGFLFLTFALAGCYTRTTVMTGLSPDLKDFYGIYPTLEVDVSALSSEEADKLKTMNADSYFSVGNAVRKSFSPYTFSFSNDDLKPQKMTRKAENWSGWLKKKPEKLAIIVNLPQTADINEIKSGGDPRILIMDLKSRFLFPETLYFEIKPGNVVQIYSEPTNPEIRRLEIKKQRKK